MLPSGGAPIFGPSDKPRLSIVSASHLDLLVAHASKVDAPLNPSDLGRLRLSMLLELSRVPDNDSPLADSKIEALASYASVSYASASALAAMTPSRTLLWNVDLDPTAFMRRTLLVADHVLVPDLLFSHAAHRPTNARTRYLALAELEHAPLIEAGHVLVVPDRAAGLVAAETATELARTDLSNKRLFSFVASQLVLEGPTAREALFVNVIDDFDREPLMWLHAHMEVQPGDESNFRARMLGTYDPAFDYGPWVEQVRRDAAAKFLQRTAERLAVADHLGANYVAASPFEARLLSRRSRRASPAAVASVIWADVPALGHLDAPDLAKLLKYEEAVGDLRERVRLAVDSAHSSSLGDNALAVADTAADLEHAGAKLSRQIRSDRTWSAIGPAALGSAGMLIGAAGGLPGLGGAAVGVLAGLVPYIATRSAHRREAAYLFMLARGAGQRKKKRR